MSTPTKAQLDKRADELALQIGRRILQLRTRHKLTQAEIATPYTAAFVSMIETGKARVSLKSLVHFASALHVQISELFRNSEP